MSVITLHNADCMNALRSMPDNAYQLAIVDPPYGGGHSVTQKTASMENEEDSGNDSTVILKPIRGGSIRPLQARNSKSDEQAAHGLRNIKRMGASLTMTLDTGTLLQRLNISMNLFAYQRIKSSGVVIISNCLKTAVFSCGERQTYRLKASQCHRVNMRGLHLTPMPLCLNSQVRERRAILDSTRRKNQWSCTNGVYRCSQTMVTRFSIPTPEAVHLKSRVNEWGSIAMAGKSTKRITSLLKSELIKSKHRENYFSEVIA